MAKVNKSTSSVETKVLPKANAYSVTTLVITLILLFATLGFALGGTLLGYKLTTAGIAIEGNLRFADFAQFSYFFPFKDQEGFVASDIMGGSMVYFFSNFIAGTGNEIVRLIYCILLMVEACFIVLFFFSSFFILGLAISSFKKGDFLSLRRATRNVGTMALFTLLPTIAMQILAIWFKPESVIISFNTLLPFIIIIYAIVVEGINSNIWHKHLKYAVSIEDIAPATKENEEEEEEDELVEFEPRSIFAGEVEEDETPAPETCSCNCSCCDEHQEKEEATIQVPQEPVEEIKEPQVEEEKPQPIEEPSKEIEQVIGETEDVKVVVCDDKGLKVAEAPIVEATTKRIVKIVGLPRNLTELGDHRFSKNGQLQIARIPSNIQELGVGCFANCYNLEEVYLPLSIKKICANALFACQKLRKIRYEGTIAQFRRIERQTNWLTHAGTNVISCSDGDILIQ